MQLTEEFGREIELDKMRVDLASNLSLVGGQIDGLEWAYSPCMHASMTPCTHCDCDLASSSTLVGGQVDSHGLSLSMHAFTMHASGMQNWQAS